MVASMLRVRARSVHGLPQENKTLDLLAPLTAAARKFAAALKRQQQKRWQPSMLPAVEVAAMLAFWFPVAGFFKDPTHVGSSRSVLRDTAQAAAQLAAALVQTWPALLTPAAAGRPGQRQHWHLNIIARRYKSHLGRGRSRSGGQGCSSAGYPDIVQLAKDNDMLLVVCRYLAYTTISDARWPQRRTAMPVANRSTSSKKSSEQQQKAGAVPTHHRKPEQLWACRDGRKQSH